MEDRIKDVLNLIKNSDFYNKIQINLEENETETFYFHDEKISHSIISTNADGQINEEVSEESIEEQKIFDRISELENVDLLITGNSREYVLVLKK